MIHIMITFNVTTRNYTIKLYTVHYIYVCIQDVIIRKLNLFGY